MPEPPPIIEAPPMLEPGPEPMLVPTEPAYDPDDLNGLAAAESSTALTPENAVVNAKSAGEGED